jgi:hypothetical protein
MRLNFGKPRRSTVVLLAGLLAAGFVLGVGALNTWRLERREVALERVCKGPSGAPKIVCDSETLVTLDPLSGVQADIVNAQRAVADSRTLPNLIAFAVFAAASTYWSWYFLLRRISELRSAFGGTPPDR